MDFNAVHFGLSEAEWRMYTDSKVHGANMGPPGSYRPQMGSMLTPWTLLSGYASLNWFLTGSDNGLSPVRHKAIIWTYDELLLIGPSGTNVSEVWIEIQQSSYQKTTFHLQNGVQIVPDSWPRPVQDMNFTGN